ncbi:transferase [Erythrobacter sp. LQ02-29]|uniref:DapH/DapD/GlmU-related protein n=1 Tax=unclassified Erythrobacter TaxID=2633097 RepID=UPI001BFC095A|nr:MULTISPECIES: DapH/DapD/GlmU-related protein [unclassified Erythrobacter]MCP9223439.1 transferase [Erythrobacter sp. LQ02-29]QWC57950.1 transferase [Erythrobacter sp. 3-20A1M]
MSDLHDTAIISPSAKLGANVSVGPFVIIGDAEIGDGCVIHSHCVIGDGVALGQKVEVFPGALIGREPKGAGATARQPSFERKIEIGDSCSIGPHSVIYYDVKIGDSTLIGDGASIREQCSVGSRCIISRYVTINYNTTVGDDAKVMDLTHLTGNMEVGSGAFVSTLVGSTNDNVISLGYGDHIVGPKIEPNATVGAGSILLPGVRIGTGALVAAGSTVTKDVDPDTTVFGTPARARQRSKDESK